MRMLFKYEPISWIGLACKSVGHSIKKSKYLRFEPASRTRTLYFPTLYVNSFTMVVACLDKSHTCAKTLILDQMFFHMLRTVENIF